MDRKWDGREGGLKQRRIVESQKGIPVPLGGWGGGGAKEIYYWGFTKIIDICIAFMCWIFVPARIFWFCPEAPLCLTTKIK